MNYVKQIDPNFGFLWIGSRSEKEKGIDRIKRSVLKNGCESGGLNVTDMDCLNRCYETIQSGQLLFL